MTGIGAKTVYEQIREAFEAIHNDKRDREQRQADEELRAIMGEIEIETVESESLQEMIAEGICFDEWVETTDVIDVEVVDPDPTSDTTDVLADCVRELEQSASAEVTVAYEVGEVREDFETFIQQALHASVPSQDFCPT